MKSVMVVKEDFFVQPNCSLPNKSQLGINRRLEQKKEKRNPIEERFSETIGMN
jgi:hypothetical protein